MNDRSTLRVLVFPADDVALRHEVDRALHDVDDDQPEQRQMSQLQDRLRPWYRSLTIRSRDALGGYDDDPTRVWYVYRDGRIRSRHEVGGGPLGGDPIPRGVGEPLPPAGERRPTARR